MREGGPVTAQTDIWETANLLSREFGDEALDIAADCAEAMAAEGDREGQQIWLRVLMAVHVLVDSLYDQQRN